MSYQVDYLGPYFDMAQRKRILRKAVKLVKDLNLDFDTVAVRGVSGLLWGSLVANKLNKHLVVSRKPNDSSHSAFRVEGKLPSNGWIIVDDFICSGATVETIHAEVVFAVKHETGIDVKDKFQGVLAMQFSGSGYGRQPKFYDVEELRDRCELEV
jgi:orotate phosphoribosyltransferase